MINPRGRIELTSPVMMEMKMSGSSADDGAILQATLGEFIELKWELMSLEDQMDFFVKVRFSDSEV